MTENKRFTQYEGDTDGRTLIDNATGKICEFVDIRYAETCCKWLNNIYDENEQLKQQKPFLKIHDDYFIQYGDDNELFNLHKPSDIRSLIYLINRENGYDELECEYNEKGYGND